MGLDMWMYGIKDISKDEIPDNMNVSWYEEHGYSLLYIDENEDLETYFKDIVPYSVVKNVRRIVTDMDRVKEDNGIPLEADIYMISSDGSMAFQWGNFKQGNTKTINLTKEQEESYKIEISENMLVCKKDELAYWRKEYDLQTLVHVKYAERNDSEVLNCGYHALDNDMMKDINKYLKKRKMDFQNINDENYVIKVYHEWY